MSELIDCLFQHIEERLKLDPFQEAQLILSKDEAHLGFQKDEAIKNVHVAMVTQQYEASLKTIQRRKESIVPNLKQQLLLLKEKKV
jgi:hypothetical protein